MLITRWYLNKKFITTLLTHPSRTNLQLIPLLTPVNSPETLPLRDKGTDILSLYQSINANDQSYYLVLRLNRSMNATVIKKTKMSPMEAFILTREECMGKILMCEDFFSITPTYFLLLGLNAASALFASAGGWSTCCICIFLVKLFKWLKWIPYLRKELTKFAVGWRYSNLRLQELHMWNVRFSAVDMSFTGKNLAEFKGYDDARNHVNQVPRNASKWWVKMWKILFQCPFKVTVAVDFWHVFLVWINTPRP